MGIWGDDNIASSHFVLKICRLIVFHWNSGYWDSGYWGSGHEGRYPSCLRRSRGALQLWQFVYDVQHQKGPEGGHLQQLPSVFYGQAEVCRHSRTDRKVPEQVCRRNLFQFAAGEEEEKTGRSALRDIASRHPLLPVPVAARRRCWSART